MHRLKKATVIATLVVCAACAKKTDAPPAAPPEVLVAPVVQQDVPVVKEWIGTLQGSVDAQIRPKVQGYLMRRAYNEGSFVRQGAVLFEIDARQFQAAYDQAAGTVGRAQAALAKTKVDVDRYTPLAAQKAVSQQELDNALAARDEATAALAAANANQEQAKLNLQWSKVTSPIDGVAGIAKAQVGDLVDGSTVLTSVSTVDPIRVNFSISEQEYMAAAERLNQAGNAGMQKLPLELILADGSVYPQKGTASALNREVDVKTGTISVLGDFPNPDHTLRPGQYAKVRAVVDTKKGALLVPQRAVSELQGSFMVGVVKPDGTAEVRPVTVGPRQGDLWVIEKGLEPGDQVVVEGLQFVRTGSKVTAKPAPARAS
ncbi:MAG TPA: efflux RND transporter periplasmic adaptor subunit [Candidatus Polarisedimenticolaceae bacterium]|nr:efflux RND transporter periplasmic adaptor subunit [Candidatus Polarisedimenticolaceae bacterium]